ncbi:MAG: class I SAM-dependent methyltransferase, partial [Gammaproteobacteria bacterium]|nr:class I SAM-dependent methyltransferase [Gammaproteobacteria bacterium]
MNIDILREAVEDHVGHLTEKEVTLTPLDCVVLAETVERSGEVILEFAAGWGVTTAVILASMKDQKLITCERQSKLHAPLSQLIGDRATFWKGNIEDFKADWPAQVDLLVLDAEHTTTCARFYIDNLWPLVRPGGYVWIHDMIDRPEITLRDEYFEVLNNLELHGFRVLRHTAEDAIGVNGWTDMSRRNVNSLS